jgi:hypothetical protein
VTNYYESPDDQFEAVKMLVFEAEAIAKSYVMEGIQSQLAEIRDEDDDD